MLGCRLWAAKTWASLSERTLVALLRRWAERKLAAGGDRILDEAMPRFEQVLIETALRFSHGRRQDAARLLGWGRNTLTRKIKEHEER
jgi:two-component system nitrogen regulation response regulator GlnG